MKIIQLTGTLAVLLGAVGAHASSTITYDWAETGSKYGDGSGTITFSAATLGHDFYENIFNGNGYDYNIVGFTGTFDGSAIFTSSLPGTGYFSNSTLGSTPAGNTLLNIEVDFYTTTNSFYTIENVGQLLGNDGGAYMIEAYTLHSNLGYDGQSDTFALDPVSAPEPGTLALATAGGLGLLAWRRRK